MPRLLACAPDLNASLGVGRVYTGSAQALRRLGWTVDYLPPAEIPPGFTSILQGGYREALRDCLLATAANYDFVEYDYSLLPFPRSIFPRQPVFVARSVLLEFHLPDIKLPSLAKGPRHIASLIANRLPLRRKKWSLPDYLKTCEATLREADLISVASPRDRDKLIALGHASEKIAVLPYGLDDTDFSTLGSVSPAAGEPPRAVFLGTFDARKGGAELPRIFTRLHQKHPRLRLRLLGTTGLYKTSAEVASFFPRSLRPSLEIFPRFDRAELPQLLSGCSLGIFPSHLESFGFSVIEKLAAGLPVFAYDVPGPGDLLPKEWLAPRGNWQKLAELAEGFLARPQESEEYRSRARAQAAPWTWDRSAELTAKAYLSASNNHRGNDTT